MEHLTKLANYAGPIALAAFAGVFLGGIALSFFWKNFGPWKMLETCREEVAKCHKERDEDAKLRAAQGAELADARARLDVMQEAMSQAGLGLIPGVLNRHQIRRP